MADENLPNACGWRWSLRHLGTASKATTFRMRAMPDVSPWHLPTNLEGQQHVASSPIETNLIKNARQYNSLGIVTLPKSHYLVDGAS